MRMGLQDIHTYNFHYKHVFTFKRCLIGPFLYLIYNSGIAIKLVESTKRQLLLPKVSFSVRQRGGCACHNNVEMIRERG